MGDERKGNLSRWTSGPEGFVENANRQLDEIERRTSPAVPPPEQVTQGGRSRDRIAVITSQTAATGDRKTYGFKWAEKSAAGYGNWQAKSGDDEKTAYNLWEELDPGNTISTSPAGNDSVTIDGVKVGRIVLVRQVADGSGGKEWWIVGGGVPVDLTVSCS